MAALSANPFSLCISTPYTTKKLRRKFSPLLASLSPSAAASNESSPLSSATKTENKAENFSVSAEGSSFKGPYAEASKPPELSYNHNWGNPKASPVVQLLQSTESTIEKVIFDFRFLALLAIGGTLAGSLLCFLNGCVYIFDAYKLYWTSCIKGVHSGQMVLRLVEAIDVYLAGTVMLIFGMGLYGLFISNVPPNVAPITDRALKGSSLFGMFALRERPKWMKISSLDELKTKVGHVIVMILLVKMFERSKMVTIATGTDLLSYSVCIFLSSASLYILHNLHRPESESESH
ncbi:uncharacterized protein LOC127246366 [Andrographis paniculata]|uniref:uncharacterized protein LOC127246366 n=1 Tax=Andrographis paniculata TaxID=175694 RepID=UPI0021E7C121|nr:uncharacterized protein LOC127246366 [Andrographis paniculata]